MDDLIIPTKIRQVKKNQPLEIHLVFRGGAITRLESMGSVEFETNTEGKFLQIKIPGGLIAFIDPSEIAAVLCVKGGQIEHPYFGGNRPYWNTQTLEWEAPNGDR